ncbi:hypothetical protein NDI48_06080 [Microcoleus sp. AS-A8]
MGNMEQVSDRTFLSSPLPLNQSLLWPKLIRQLLNTFAKDPTQRLHLRHS